MNSIPKELKALRQWVCYRIEERDGTPTKIPYRTDKVGRGNARTNDPATWHTFDEVMEAVQKPRNRFNGIGFVLAKVDPYVFIDLDHVVDGDQMEDWARLIVQQVGSYTELSQSGTGIHIIARAKKPGPRCRTHSKPKFEIYEDVRLVVFTGKQWPGSSPEIADAQPAVSEIYREVFGDNPLGVPPKETERNARPVGMSDPVLIKEALGAKNGPKFERLWHGNTGEYNNDHSAADMALSCILAYWTDKDPIRMDRLFRESGLMRAKWDELRGSQTYGQITIATAIGMTQKTYADQIAKRQRKKPPGDSDEDEVGDIPYGPDGEPLNDLGNARRLVKKHGDSIRFCHDAGKWFCWDGRRWARDETGEIVRKAKLVVDEMLKQALAMRKLAESSSDDRALELAKSFERHAVSSGNHRRTLALISQAESEPAVTILASDLDADPWAFNCANGTVDLRTGELRPHGQRDLLSKISDVAYHPDAQCPMWESFVSGIFDGDEELVRFAQSAAGYTLTGDTREQVFFILHGCGSNGKSTFIGVLRDIFGDYETKTSTDTLVEKKNSNQSNDVAALRGARLVSAIETSAGKRLAEALVKELTGQDAVTARFLYQEFFTFVPVFKLWLACNHVPFVQGQDHGIWRRIRLVPFAVQFQDADHPSGPYKDKDLPEKLKAEHEGILAWLVRGCLHWQKNGLPSASAVRSATNQLQEEMDMLGGFLAECCVFDPRVEVSARELYHAYCEWAEENGEKVLSQRGFGLRLGERGKCKRQHCRDGWRWTGIRLAYAGEDVTVVTDVTQPTRKSSVCAREEDQEYIESSGNAGSYGSQQSRDADDDGLDWSNGVAF